MNKATILIVEDEAIIAADLALKLARLGYEVIGRAFNGEQAVTLARERRPNLVLMDIRLRGPMGGVEAAALIRKEWDIPVVYLTAHSDRETLQRAKLTEPFGFLLKPFEELELESHIEMALYKHQTERKLRQSEERLRLTTEAARVGTWDYDVNTGEFAWSDSLEERMGFSRGTFPRTAKAFLELLHPESRVVYETTQQRALADQGAFQAELRFCLRDGRERWGLFCGRAICDDADKPVRLVGVDVDITEKKRSERIQLLTAEILAALNEPLSLQETVSGILGMIRRRTGVDATGIRLRDGTDFPYFGYEGFSRDFIAAENMLLAAVEHRCAHALNGGPTLECTCGLVLSGDFDPVDQRFTSGGSFWTNNSRLLLECPASMDERFRPRNRCIHEGYQSIALVPIRIGQRIVGLLQLNARLPNSFTLDMIRYFEGIAASFGVAVLRKQAEEALRASEQRFRDIVFTTADWIWEVDAEGRYTYASETVEHLLGYKPEEIIGRTPFDFMPPDEAERIRKEFGEIAARKEPFSNLENANLHKDGSVRYLLTSGVPIFDKTGRLMGYRGSDKDITPRRGDEQRLRQYSEQLRALSAHIESLREAERVRISREIHDELGQMLTGLKMDLSWLERKIGDAPASPETNQWLDRMVAASALVDETISSVQRIATELRPSALDKLGLCTALRQETRRFNLRTGIACETDFPDAIPNPGIDTATALFRIYQEALTNVARHAEASQVRASLGLASGMLNLTVFDNGRGISEAALHDPAALGLLGMKERAAALGGSMKILPEPQGGTTIAVCIPVEPEQTSNK